MHEYNLPDLTVAPMEGLTTFVWRKIHAKYFGAADRYYLPFVSPTVEPAFTQRQLRELAPEINEGFTAVPQLLTRRSDDFIWAARALADMGYKEVNLNCGCPAGTVVAKGKGSGFLKEPHEMEAFFNRIFDADLPIAISVKTRLGWCEEKEFDAISEVYSHFPIDCLIIHARLKTDQYKGEPRMEAFDRAAKRLTLPLGYNGDLTTLSDILSIHEKYPDLSQLMAGRPLMGDPALFRKAKGGLPASREEIKAFTEELFDSYTEAFGSRNNALMRMKEYWFYQLGLFEGGSALSKAIFKSRTPEAFGEALKPVFELPIRTDAERLWFKVRD